MCDSTSRPTTDATDATSDTAPAAVTATYSVTGMTCGHCVGAVSGEVGALPGVTDVVVDLAGGTVTVTSASPLDPGHVRAAVEEAGYELVSP